MALSFPFRNTWLTKGVLACAKDPLAFTRKDAMVELGVGKNMSRSGVAGLEELSG